MFSEAAISARGLSKAYLLYREPRDRLRQAVRPRLVRLLRRLGVRLAERQYYAEHWALRDVSFEVGRGETVALIGRNGAGKSTLLQLICGTLTPSAGEVVVRGRVAALLELGSGFNPEYTGRENVLLNAAVLGLPREVALARMEAILGFAEIGSFVDQPVKTYSSGMTMRLAFAVAAHVDAEVLLVDEALAVGDAYFQQKCFRWLREFQRRGTLLFCGHDLGAVVGLCERAIWIDRGRVRLAGPAKEVADAYASFAQAESMGLGEQGVTLATQHSRAAGGEPGEGGDLPLGGIAFGSGQARITGLRLADPEGEPLRAVQGGQLVELTVTARALAPVSDVIIGFQLKDRLGQQVFAQNSFLSYAARPVAAAAGQVLRAAFRFRMPALAEGDYTLGAAIASGTQQQHLQHHFVHEVLAIHIRPPRQAEGLLSVPFSEVTLMTGPG
jgi:lipopolysaccharide transport system ATP-binding protein